VQLSWHSGLGEGRAFDGKGKGQSGVGCLAATSQVQSSKLKEWRSFLLSKQKKEEIMPLIHLIVVLVVVGVVLYLVNTYIPMAGSIKSILNAVVIIVVVLWLLSVFGLIGELSTIRVGK
jgi:hypothetical protein